MRSLMKLNNNQIKRHIIIWIFIFTYWNIYTPVPGSLIAKVIGGTIEDINYLFVFYSITLFILPKYWNYRWLGVIIGGLLSYLLFTCVTYLNYLIIIPKLEGKVFYQDYPISVLLIDDVFYFFIIALAARANFFYRYSIYNYNLQAEKEKSLLLKELVFLKSQFNSHITFNFLNYCYSKVHRESTEVANSISLFSDILRYSLQVKPDEKIPLDEEINYIQNYIGLQNHLYNNNVHLKLLCTGQIKNVTIYPGILISIVEDAFYFGVFNDPNFPISIKLDVTTGRISFLVRNKIKTEKNEATYNTSSFNLTQTLKLNYKDNYMLRKEADNEFFITELIIFNLQ